MGRPDRHAGAMIRNAPYTPMEWDEHQRKLHKATCLDAAMHQASMLAGGWYRRPVTVEYRIACDNTEEYRLRPSDSAGAEDWIPLYEVTRL